MDQKNSDVLHDITDILVELDGHDDDTIFLDLESEDTTSLEPMYSVQKNIQHNSSDKLILNIAKEISGANSLKELYQILTFTVMGQLGASSASIIHPSSVAHERWILTEHHGMRLKNKNVTFKLNDIILSTTIKQNKTSLISDYEDIVEAQEEYQKLFSIGTQLIVPVIISKELMFALLVGNKLKSESFTDDDLSFIQAVVDITAVIFSKIFQLDQMQSQLTELSMFQKRLDLIDNYESSVRHSATRHEIDQIIQKELASLEINSYALFFRNDSTNLFEILFCEQQDKLNLKKSSFSISSSNAFTTYCLANEGYSEITDPVTSSILKDLFQTEFLLKINLFGVYPYVIQNQLIGYLILLRVNIEKYKQHVNQIKRFTRFVFSHLQSSKYLIYAHPYTDTLQPLFTRLRELQTSCFSTHIPLTLIIATINGYTDYTTSCSLQDIANCNNQITDLLNDTMHEGDFSFRFDHDRFVLALPGRKKKTGLGYTKILTQLIEDINDGFTLISSVYELPKDGDHVESLFTILS